MTRLNANRQLNPVPLAVPCLQGREWELIKECLDTNWVSYAGPFVDRFERELAAAAGASRGVATASGTAALHIALLLAGVKPDDEVVMPGLSFVAPANAVRYCGAWPVFTDVRADDWQWDIEQVADYLERNAARRNGELINTQTGRRIACLLPVHLLGGMCDVDAVVELANRFELPIVEDAAECLGATFRGRPVGAPVPAYGGPLRIVITSFNGNKIITTGGGGALFTEDEKLARRARHLTTTAKADPIEFFHDEVGYNYRLTNVAAAMGLAQLEQLPRYVEIKRSIAARYAEAFAAMGDVTVHPEPAHCRSTYWMYTVLMDRKSRPVIDRMNAAGVCCRPLWVPLARLPPFAEKAPAPELPVIADLYKRAVSLPCSVGLTAAEQRRVIDTFQTAVG